MRLAGAEKKKENGRRNWRKKEKNGADAKNFGSKFGFTG